MIDLDKKEIILWGEETDKALKFATELANKKFQFWSDRDKTLTLEKTIENLYRGKCGEIAAYRYLVAKNHKVSEVDFVIHDFVDHDADLVVIGHGIELHVKTCLRDFTSWLFEKDARYVCN